MFAMFERLYHLVSEYTAVSEGEQRYEEKLRISLGGGGHQRCGMYPATRSIQISDHLFLMELVF
jgi:hypothetical protein